MKYLIENYEALLLLTIIGIYLTKMIIEGRISL